MASRAQSSTSTSATPPAGAPAAGPSGGRGGSGSAGARTAGPSGDRAGGTVHSHSGQGRTVHNLVFLAVCLAIMLGSFWAFASYPNSPVIWVVGLLLYTLALLVPVTLLHNTTAKRAVGGRAVAMDVPTTTEVAGTEDTAAELGQGTRDTRARDAQVHAEHRDDKYGRAVE